MSQLISVNLMLDNHRNKTINQIQLEIKCKGNFPQLSIP